MAEHRLKLDAILRQIVKDAYGKENVYYQPPRKSANELSMYLL